MTRILHVSDTHLGYGAYARLAPSGLNQREEDFFQAFSRVVENALSERVDAVLHTGDLFDVVRPTNRALAFALEEVRRLTRAGIPFVCIAGNHEQPRIRETGSPLRFLDFFDGAHAAYRGKPETFRLGGLGIVAVPQASDQEALERNLEGLAPPQGADATVLMLHASVAGVDGFRRHEFNEQHVPAHVLDAGFDYVALGHFHGHARAGERAWYAGSTERTSFGEAGETKGFALVALGDGGPKVAFHELPARPMLDLPPVHCRELAERDIEPTIGRRIGEAKLAGAVARLRVLDVPAHVQRTLDRAAIRKATRDALHFELRCETVRPDASGLSAGLEFDTLETEFLRFAKEVPLEAADRRALEEKAAGLLAQASHGPER